MPAHRLFHSRPDATEVAEEVHRETERGGAGQGGRSIQYHFAIPYRVCLGKGDEVEAGG